ncbi:DUF2950 domain-containing protein [Undibacterium sp.]|uniref:DUF2950 domain-containing protein n=1 Tax=Undibacterium sp. TaxID=1914977 RepID=UPI00374DA60B
MDMKFKALPIVFSLVATVTGVAGLTAATGEAQAATKNGHGTTRHAVQANFASADEAVVGLIAAMRSDNHKLLHEVLGSQADRYIRSPDADFDNTARSKFLAAYDEKSRIELKGDTRAVLHIGNDDWPVPFPLVQAGGRWHFDTRAGIREWQDRRLGENELSAIQVELAYVDAQREYVLRDHNQDGLLEYAQRIVSTEGQHDGLYWHSAEGEPESPMGQAFADADKPMHGAARLQGRPFHGYYFRILTAQGKSAPGGALDYMVRNKLIGGYALIAYPASYSESGIKTFIVNHNGTVYSKDLGPHTVSAAQAIKRFDPDRSWSKEAQ